MSNQITRQEEKARKTCKLANCAILFSRLAGHFAFPQSPGIKTFFYKFESGLELCALPLNSLGFRHRTRCTPRPLIRTNLAPNTLVIRPVACRHLLQSSG